jgi:nickel transport protein
MARFAALCLILAPAPALAHKLNLFAHADGAMISGRAYFSGDIAARQIDVIARAASGREIGRTKTDDEGSFTFPARIRIDYHLTAETADGHAASYVVSAAELPGNLPTDSAAPAKQPPTPAAEGPSNTAAAESKNEPIPAGAQIEALRKQIESMREQIDQTEQRIRFRDIVGGIGYILGLAGVGFYLKARQREVTRITRNQH